MRLPDLIVIALYLAVTAAIGLTLSGRQRNSKAYFVGEGDVPTPMSDRARNRPGLPVQHDLL